MKFFYFFSRFRRFLSIFIKYYKRIFFGSLKRLNNIKKTYVAFIPWCENDSSIFFSVSKAFLKEYPMILILIPEVWRNEVFSLHISYSTKLWFIHSFPFWPGSGSAFFFVDPDADPQIYDPYPDPDRAKTCGSETLSFTKWISSHETSTPAKWWPSTFYDMTETRILKKSDWLVTDFFFFELIVFTFFNDLAFQKNTTFVDAYYILVNHSLISPENGFYKPLSFKLLTLKSLLTPLPISSCKSVKLMRPPLKCYEKLHNIR